jgi:hypothetical protein
MAWTVETLNDVVDAELDELTADMQSSFVHIELALKRAKELLS